MAKATTLDAEAIGIKEETPFTIVMRRFRKHRLAMISAVVMTLIFLVSIFAMQIAPFKPDEIDVGSYFLPVGSYEPAENGVRQHLLGTDQIGRDYFSRLLYAARISLTVAITSVLISTLIGVVVGSISGFLGGTVDAVLMRFVEFLITIPTLPLLLIISAIVIGNEDAIPIPQVVLQVMGQLMLLTPRDSRQAVLIIMVLAGLGWTGVAQLMRGMVLSLRDQTFVEASRSLGSSTTRIIFVHMIPNAMAPIIVAASLGLSGYIIAEASLSFLGLGIQDPVPTWGNMLAATQQYMFDRPYLPLIPGLPIFLCSLAFNYIGDGLRDALDPRLKK